MAPIDVNSKSPTAASKLQVAKPQILPAAMAIQVENGAVKRSLDGETTHRRQQHLEEQRLEQHLHLHPAKRQRVSVGREAKNVVVPTDEGCSPERVRGP